MLETIETPKKRFRTSLGPYKKKHSDKKIARIYAKNGFRLYATCKELGITVNTFYRWLETNDDLRENINTLKEEVKDKVETSLIEQAEKGNPQVLIFLAKTLLKDRGYAEETNVNNNTQVNIVLPEDTSKKYQWWGHSTTPAITVEESNEEEPTRN